MALVNSEKCERSRRGETLSGEETTPSIMCMMFEIIFLWVTVFEGYARPLSEYLHDNNGEYFVIYFHNADFQKYGSLSSRSRHFSF